MSKASVESELNQLEQDWAEFCQDTLTVKGVIEETIQMWNDFEENRDKLAEWLGELERAHAEVSVGPANLDALKDELEKKKVRERVENYLYLLFANYFKLFYSIRCIPT